MRVRCSGVSREGDTTKQGGAANAGAEALLVQKHLLTSTKVQIQLNNVGRRTLPGDTASSSQVSVTYTYNTAIYVSSYCDICVSSYCLRETPRIRRRSLCSAFFDMYLQYTALVTCLFYYIYIYIYVG
jgi:hypothetical protein